MVYPPQQTTARSTVPTLNWPVDLLKLTASSQDYPKGMTLPWVKQQVSYQVVSVNAWPLLEPCCESYLNLRQC